MADDKSKQDQMNLSGSQSQSQSKAEAKDEPKAEQQRSVQQSQPQQQPGQQQQPASRNKVPAGQAPPRDAGPAAAVQPADDADAAPGALPTADDLRRMAREHYGGDSGTARVDAAPANDPHAGPTRIVFVDRAGNETGRRDYHPQKGPS